MEEKIAQMLIGVCSDYLSGGVSLEVLKSQVKFAHETFFQIQIDVQRCSACTDEGGHDIGNMYVCPSCGRAVS